MVQADPKRSLLFVVLPNVNVWNTDDPGSSQSFMRSASRMAVRGPEAKAPARPAMIHAAAALDRVAPNDTVLLSLDQAQRLALQREYPGLRIVPVTRLAPLWLRRIDVSPVMGASSGRKQTLDVEVVDAATGKPLAGVDVVGFTDRAERVGNTGRTNARGIARLAFPASVTSLESVEAIPESGYWPAYVRRVSLADGRARLQAPPIDLAAQDIRSHFKLIGEDADGHGVKVGVIDTGASRHADLHVRRGRNVVKGEPPADVTDHIGHGTHVAGIIAGRGRPGQGVRGVAPGADLHVYKVFGKEEETASSFHIAKAIRMAVDDGCDLVNLSLGGDSEVPDVLREIQRARAMGVVCIAAAGNDYRSEVDYPGRYSQVLAVSASGRKGVYPAHAAQVLSAAKPFGTDPKDYVADFSNVGSEISLIGPGVGIVSAYPGGYAVMDGTSMACPAIVGAAARLLARSPRILGMDRNQNRSDAVVKMALDAARPLGLGAGFEGAGILV
ncbi:subtilisin-like protease [Bordetella ansorpii]|uniref:Subtilisin-like protease n=1 Tax=Bordetella ansorpii TaxID=288768 RepID=A0A146AFZ4_9BORD|nr:S8 family serine peptidase [Bordetella ansorpii]CZZ87007.1 subtilisin-like protease [Bordetella ansorpii]